MAEPLNDFLESAEAYIEDPCLTDEELGYRIRAAWENFKTQEENPKSRSYKITNINGEPVVVSIPCEG